MQWQDDTKRGKTQRNKNDTMVVVIEAVMPVVVWSCFFCYGGSLRSQTAKRQKVTVASFIGTNTTVNRANSALFVVDITFDL